MENLMTTTSLQQTADFAMSPTTWSFILCRFNVYGRLQETTIYHSKFKALLNGLTALKFSFSGMAQKCSTNFV
jgi:hypothetical protein